ncbi:hypothetical protein GQX74_003962 [Glossina fuscipes]|nr:hypothetical protein GQX74_003962 [Glossina fuscipes]
MSAINHLTEAKVNNGILHRRSGNSSGKCSTTNNKCWKLAYKAKGHLCNNDDDFYQLKSVYHQKQNQQRHYSSPSLSATRSNTYCSSSSSSSSLSSSIFCFIYSSQSVCLWCFTFLSLVCLLMMHNASAEPQGCILCEKSDLKGKDPQTNYEEFRFEHQVTRQDAINALRRLNDSFYEGPEVGNSCNAVRCTSKLMKYCLSSQFINDHCLCELGHNLEKIVDVISNSLASTSRFTAAATTYGYDVLDKLLFFFFLKGLPYVPHICYVGEKAYTASVGSCFIYEEVKDCCCAPALATQCE